MRGAAWPLTGWPVPAQADALRVAFPGYMVNVLVNRRDKPRFEVVNRDGGDPYCLISSDAQEIWRELRGTGGAQLSGCLVQHAEGHAHEVLWDAHGPTPVIFSIE